MPHNTPEVMKGTEHFVSVIKSYLDNRASYDELFAVAYAKPHKNIEDCATYIINEAYKSGCAGLSDDEVYSLAVHFFDEDDLETGKPIDCKVVINQHVELTEEEKAQARKDAMKRIENEAYAKMKQTKKPTKPTEVKPQASLFDF